MGGRKKRIGRLGKYCEKKRQERKINPPGRPSKRLTPNKLLSTVVLPSASWMVRQDSEHVQYIKLATPVVTVNMYCITVRRDMSWQVSVFGRHPPSNCHFLSKFPANMTKRAFQQLLDTLDRTTICAGHPDEQFVEYLKSKSDRVVQSPDGTVAAYLDSTPVLNGQTQLHRGRFSTVYQCCKLRVNNRENKSVQTISVQHVYKHK